MGEKDKDGETSVGYKYHKEGYGPQSPIKIKTTQIQEMIRVDQRITVQKIDGCGYNAIEHNNHSPYIPQFRKLTARCVLYQLTLNSWFKRGELSVTQELLR